ncbi:hypothetical protein FACS189413_01310 [Bacteroidia bacterium]|nr:hypothetical protein FACS189413_01310 [Bacteroidia bacterium]
MKHKIIKTTVILLTLAAITPFFLLMGKLLSKVGMLFDPVLSSDLQGGILYGIYCGALIFVSAVIMTVPVGIWICFHIQNHPKNGLSVFLSKMEPVWAGAPPVLIAIAVYRWMVEPMGHVSIWAGSVVTALLLFPKIIHVTGLALQKHAGLHENAMALGGSPVRIATKVMVPSASRQIAAGVVAAVAQMLGTCTILMITTFGISEMRLNWNGPGATVTLLTWDFFRRPETQHLVWPMALFVIIIIDCFLIVSQLLYPKYDKRIYT